MTHQSMLAMLLSLSALTIGAGAHAQDTVLSPSSSMHAADNTGTNARDRSQATTTSTSQPNDKADVKLVASVRRAITKDSSLSTLAHNIKIVAVNGTVTLRGPVKSDDEKSRIETTVRGVTGVQQVVDELEVKP